MDKYLKYEFDTSGYIVIKNVISKNNIKKINSYLNQFENLKEDELPFGVCHGKKRQKDELYLSNIVEAEKIFIDLISIPKIIKIIDFIHAGNYRLNHTYSIHRWKKGYTYLHMGPVPVHPKAIYHFKGNEMFSLLSKVVFPILNCKPEDGCFAVIPGSHKANYERPFSNHPKDNPMLVPVNAEPGDAIIFTEALTHGSFINTSGRIRRTLFYCYSVGYMPDWGNLSLKFSDDFHKRLNSNQKKIIQLK